jgi:hypothetical protein
MRAHPAVLGGLISLALLVHPARPAIAQTPSLSTINILHQLTFQYPATWDVILDSTHVASNPQSDAYGTNEALELKSPDDVVEVWLFIDPQLAGPATAALQNIFDNLSADPGSYPNFQVVNPVTNARIQGADSGSEGEAAWTINGELQNVHYTEGMRGATLYNLEIVWTAGQLGAYQNQVQAIADSFQLLP